MKARIRRRGAPLGAIVLIVGSWTATRIAVLGGGGILPPGIAGSIGPTQQAEAEAIAAQPDQIAQVQPLRRTGTPTSPLSLSDRDNADWVMTERRWPVSPPAASLHPASPPAPPAKLADAVPFFPSLPSRNAAQSPVGKRWSADAWALVRPGDDGRGPLLARYGASQAGAVIRYRLAPGDGHRPVAYLRAATAFDRSRQREGALGLSARALPDVPLVVAAEMRVTSDRFGTRTRPAALAYTEIPPFDLSPRLRGEAYLQGGYVGGRDATAFVDARVRVDQALIDLGRTEIRFGAGAWTGAQEGAARLDVGPGAQIAIPLAKDVFARLELDWRFRIAGDATPGSGPALTLSAGF